MMWRNVPGRIRQQSLRLTVMSLVKFAARGILGLSATAAARRPHWLRRRNILLRKTVINNVTRFNGCLPGLSNRMGSARGPRQKAEESKRGAFV